jgi:hypothetical protein
MAADEFGNLVADVGEFDPYAHPNPALAAMEHMPGMGQAAGFTAFRGSNTILKGGWADKPRRIGKSPIQSGGMLRNNSPRPRSWSRYGSQDVFFGGAGAKKYSPFAAGSGLVNVAAKRGVLGTRIQDLSRDSLKLGGALTADGKERVVGRGMLSQITAAERAGRMKNLKGAGGLGSYFSKAKGVPFAGQITDPKAARTAIYASMKGSLGQRVGGYMAGLHDPALGMYSKVMEGAVGQEFGAAAAKSSSALKAGGLGAKKFTMREGAKGIATAYRGGMTKAAGKQLTGLAAKKVGMSAAAKTGAAVGLRAVGMAIPYVNIAMAVWMAYDVGKLITTAAIPGSARLATDAYKSYVGTSNQKMFGGSGFKISEAAVTSRQRGVMAIQNSRLNARSVLGSEAGGMAAHFG